MKFKFRTRKRSEPEVVKEAYESYYSHGGLAPGKHPDDDHAEVHSGEAKYKCPMGCEGDKTYESPGNCPVCNMKLVPVKNFTHEPRESSIVK